MKWLLYCQTIRNGSRVSHRTSGEKGRVIANCLRMPHRDMPVNTVNAGSRCANMHASVCIAVSLLYRIPCTGVNKQSKNVSQKVKNQLKMHNGIRPAHSRTDAIVVNCLCRRRHFAGPESLLPRCVLSVTCRCHIPVSHGGCHMPASSTPASHSETGAMMVAMVPSSNGFRRPASLTRYR